MAKAKKTIRPTQAKRPRPASKSSKSKAGAAQKKAKPRRAGRFQAPPPVVEKKGASVGRSNKFVPADRLRELHRMLLALRERFTGQINFLAADNLSRSDKDAVGDFRSEEQGTDNFDRDFALNRVSLKQDIVLEIDEALNRIKLGTYGMCEGCGKGVEKARLDALPYSRMCVACQSAMEKGRLKFRSFDSNPLFPNADKAAPEPPSDDA